MHGEDGFNPGTATAYGYDGSYLGTVLGPSVSSKQATFMHDTSNYVMLGNFAQPITRITFSNGVIDDFSFTTAANNQADIVRVQPGQTAGPINFGDAVSTGTATFVGPPNTTTQGNWKSFTGADGSVIPNEMTRNPMYVIPTVSGQLNYTWAASTTDVRALNKTPSASTDRIASCWYTDISMTFDLDFTDTQKHSVSIYAVDWDHLMRSERIDVIDPSTGSVLDSQTLSSFDNGEYLTWQLSGHVQLEVTKLNAMNAVVSGIFFGAPLSPANSATYVGKDTATQGNWMGKYGKEGDDVINDSTNYPAYATVTPTGQTSYTWAGSTNDSRALERPAGGRIAATWFSNTSETIDINLTDNKAHNISIYALDWDNASRSEQVQLFDATTGAQLDTQPLSSFSGGTYLTWKVSGHVQIKITKTGGANAVVSGLFFDPAS